MKVLVFLFMLICASKCSELIAVDEFQTYLDKFVLNNLTNEEGETLQDMFEILSIQSTYLPAILKNKHTVYPNYRRSFFGNIMSSLRCIACRSVFSALFTGVAFGISDERLISIATEGCVLLRIQPRHICKGAVELNLPIINYIYREGPGVTGRVFCSLIMQTSQADVCPHNDPLFEWTVVLPKVPESLPAPQTNQRSLKVAILTDVHIDPLYKPYGVAECGEPTCCRKGQTLRTQDFPIENNIDDSLYERIIVEKNGEMLLNLSIAPEIRQQRNLSNYRIERGRNAAPAGYWGDYRNCDTPLWAFNDVIDRIAEAHPDIDMVYYLGDTMNHRVWETTYDLNKESNHYVIEKMKTSFGKDVIVVPVIGNHEAQPVNQFAPKYITRAHNTTWLYKALAEKWGPYLTEEARSSLLVRGGYSLRPIPGFKIIVVNNNIPQRYNWWLVYDPLDPKRHLEWLIQELSDSELAGEKVHILAHIPPGAQDLMYTWTREYNRVINRFSSTIAAEFNGHEHSDQFKLFYSADGSPISVAWGAGGVTTYSNYNPNYKIVDIDSSSFEPTSMQSYSYNLTEANLTPERRPRWFQLYDLKSSFNLPDLSPASIDNLVNLMSSGGKYLDLYLAYFSKQSDVHWSQCDKACKIDNLCNIVITVLWDRRKCENITSSLFAKAR